MKTKDIQELYQIKLHSMDTILHQISLMDQVENEQELSEIIHSLLQAIGNYTGADRVYVFDWETDQKDSLSNTFEWCADEVTPEIDNLQAIPVSLMPNWVKRFENKEVIVINDLEATKCSEPEEYELLKTQEICSLIAVPIYANHQMNGFIGVDNPDLRQNEISITLLSDVGGHLGCVRENLKSTVLLKKALDEATKRTEIISAIATLYITIIYANVKERTYELLEGYDLVEKILGQKGKIDDVMESIPTAFAALEGREKYREFLDFDTLEERLRSRFEMGLTVDIKAPTYETRMAILRKKVAEENINIDDSILDYIASNIISNIRELQGAINKVLSFSDFCNTEITLESAKKALVDIINPNMKRQITIDYIMETVADHFHITMKDLLSSKRNSNIVYPRHICMYLCRQLTNSTYEEIGSKIGNRHHSTILHGEEIIKKKLDEGDEESIKTIDVLTKKIDPQ